MTKGVKVALNVKSYKAATADDDAEANNMLYLNFEYKCFILNFGAGGGT